MTEPALSDTSAAAAHRAVARDVLRQEAEALTALSDALPSAFAPAVQAILAATGRVIVAGLGKSGHVGRKIAATLASTGTPADFLHAAEAAHGDMGMIVPGDVALLISRSGETAELAPILYYVTRFDIPLVAITSRPGSTLARAADHALILPDRPEACPIGMAPTTSTTMTLALGDALAMALLQARGFRAEDFRTFHPGGKLGAQLRTAGELMHGGATTPVVGPAASMDEVLLTMTARGFGLAALTDDRGRLAGVITDGDLRRNMAGLMERRPADIASRDPVTIPPGCLASEALALMNDRKVGALVVVEDGRPVGVLHLHDLLRAGVA